jgi:hypothetical protein
MAPDPHTGGRVEDMAAEGTTIPGDAGQQRLIVSVPRPDQINPGPPTYSHTNPAHAAAKVFDIPRGTADRGVTDEATTAAGGQMPSSIEKKTFDSFLTFVGV